MFEFSALYRRGIPVMTRDGRYIIFNVGKAYVLVSCALTDVDESKFMWITANGCWWWSQDEVVDIPSVLTKAPEARETDLEKVPYGHQHLF